MSLYDLMEGVSILVHTFEDSIFTAFCIMLAFSVALGIKRVMLE